MPTPRRTLRTLAVAAVCLSANAALACPMCKAAAEADDKLPRAFMASILFMLAVPFTLATGFGVAFYRLSQQRPVEGVEPEGYSSDDDIERFA